MINKEKLHDIIEMSKTKFGDQNSHLYWKTSTGLKEISQEEKRFIAILEAADIELDLGLVMEYKKENK